MTPQERDARDCNAIAHNAAELAPGWARVVPLAQRTLSTVNQDLPRTLCAARPMLLAVCAMTRTAVTASRGLLNVACARHRTLCLLKRGLTQLRLSGAVGYEPPLDSCACCGLDVCEVCLGGVCSEGGRDGPLPPHRLGRARIKRALAEGDGNLLQGAQRLRASLQMVAAQVHAVAAEAESDATAAGIIADAMPSPVESRSLLSQMVVRGSQPRDARARSARRGPCDPAARHRSRSAASAPPPEGDADLACGVRAQLTAERGVAVAVATQLGERASAADSSAAFVAHALASAARRRTREQALLQRERAAAAAAARSEAGRARRGARLQQRRRSSDALRRPRCGAN